MFPLRLVRYLVATLLCPLAALAEPLPDPDRAERESVAAALGWLARHQELDGRWRATGEREHGFEALYEPDAASGADVLATSAALMALLGGGSSPWAGPYREATRRAWEWLIAEQQKIGGGALARGADAPASATLAERQRAARAAHVARLNHLWGTLALLEVAASAEALEDGDIPSRAEDRRRVEAALPPAEAAVGFVTGDAALKPAVFDFLDARTATMDELSLLAAIGFDATMLKARADLLWFTGVAEAIREVQKGMTGTRVPYRVSDDGVYWFGGSVSTPQSMMAFVHLFERGSAVQMSAAGPGLLKEGVAWGARWTAGAPGRHGSEGRPGEMANELGWFWEGMAFRSYAALNAEHWARWRRAFVPVAVANQRRSGGEAGSWDPAGPHARVFGRETGTAWMAITLDSGCRLRMARTHWDDLKPNALAIAMAEFRGKGIPTREQCAVCGAEVMSNGVFSKGDGPKTWYFCGQEHLDEFERDPESFRSGKRTGGGGEGSHR